MKRISLFLIIIAGLFYVTAKGQQISDNSKIDIMLVRGEYKRVIDTCRHVLTTDSLNAEIYYKMGLACMNLLPDDKSFDYFLKAASIMPDNILYKFMVAKSYYSKGKNKQAKALFQSLCFLDSMNWVYSYYLASIYMNEGKYDESINIYNRFYNQDSTNYVFLDKIGFAYLKKEEYEKAIGMYNKSLEINPKNINSLKNLAYLYSITTSATTALKLLTKGIEIDSTDMDLYERRAALNFTIFNYKKALYDYLKLISSGDSSVLNLKRAGIGLANNTQPKESIEYLLKAFQKDTADLEVLSYLAQNYFILKDAKNSAYYYNCKIKLLNPVVNQLGLSYILLGEALKSGNQYNEAISAYNKSQEYRSDNYVIMIIANLYDQKLNNIPKATHYYELYLRKENNPKNEFVAKYNESIRKRIESLKKTDQTSKQSYSVQNTKF